MSKWETLEAHLSFTYSIFEGRPIDHKFIEDYGRENSIFKNRMERLEKSAERYFQSKPDQVQEGRFACLLKQAKELSSYRHNIAHGMVVGLDLPSRQVFVLVPPAHGFFHLTKKTGDYSYRPTDIASYTRRFNDLSRLVQAFNHERHPPKRG